MRPATLCLMVLLGCTSAVQAEKPRTIVGLWDAPDGTCKKDEGAMTIGPKSLESIDVYCKFRTVRRKGNTVIWKGPCDGAEGSNEQTVTATERNGVLTITYSPGGNVVENLRRCK